VNPQPSLIVGPKPRDLSPRRADNNAATTRLVTPPPGWTGLALGSGVSGVSAVTNSGCRAARPPPLPFNTRSRRHIRVVSHVSVTLAGIPCELLATIWAGLVLVGDGVIISSFGPAPTAGPPLPPKTRKRRHVFVVSHVSAVLPNRIPSV